MKVSYKQRPVGYTDATDNNDKNTDSTDEKSVYDLVFTLTAFDGVPVIIVPKDYYKTVASTFGPGVYGLDTESDYKTMELRIIQVFTGHEVYIFGADVFDHFNDNMFVKFLKAKDRIKVGVDIDTDASRISHHVVLPKYQHSHRERKKFRMNGCIDLQSIARSLGETHISLEKLASKYVESFHSNPSNLGNYINPTPEQYIYAANDAILPCRIYENLIQRLPCERWMTANPKKLVKSIEVEPIPPIESSNDPTTDTSPETENKDEDRECSKCKARRELEKKEEQAKWEKLLNEPGPIDIRAYNEYLSEYGDDSDVTGSTDSGGEGENSCESSPEPNPIASSEETKPDKKTPKKARTDVKKNKKSKNKAKVVKSKPIHTPKVAKTQDTSESGQTNIDVKAKLRKKMAAMKEARTSGPVAAINKNIDNIKHSLDQIKVLKSEVEDVFSSGMTVMKDGEVARKILEATSPTPFNLKDILKDQKVEAENGKISGIRALNATRNYITKYNDANGAKLLVTLPPLKKKTESIANLVKACLEGKEDSISILDDLIPQIKPEHSSVEYRARRLEEMDALLTESYFFEILKELAKFLEPNTQNSMPLDMFIVVISARLKTVSDKLDDYMDRHIMATLVVNTALDNGVIYYNYETGCVEW
jgi:hypothetical protein